MNQQKKYLLLQATGLLFALNSTAFAATNCDVNGDGKEGLAESIHALQVVAGMAPAPAAAPGAFINSKSMVFNLIPAGTFTMGSPDGNGTDPAEPGRGVGEAQHEVTLTKSFYMQTTEVTNGQWSSVIFSTPPSWDHTEGNYPVQNVNWYEAAYFTDRLSGLESLTKCYNLADCSPAPGEEGGMVCNEIDIDENCTGYRLPTEAEWEYAARAGTTTAWPYFHEYDTSAVPGQVTDHTFNSNLSAVGWYEWNNYLHDQYPDGLNYGYASGTKPVAKKQPNKWGLFDMNGNVSEHCQDWSQHNYYLDPASGTDPQGPATGLARVIRGGSWVSQAHNARSANRNAGEPIYRDSTIGFRVVLPVH